MRRPRPLKKGDRVALIAPASCHVKQVESSVEVLEKMGFSVKVYPGCYQEYGWMAGKDEERAKDLMDAFTDKEVQGIFCLRGGCGSYRLLPLLDYEVIKSNQKTFVGYSDITALHLTFMQKAGMMVYHAPMPSSEMMQNPDPYTKEFFERMIFSENPQGEMENPKGFPLEWANSLSAQGTLTGGNLSLFVHLLATKYEPDVKGKILFLEDVGENLEQLERKFYHLKLSGKLEEAAGFILGQFTDAAVVSEPSFTLWELFKNNFPADKPLVYNFQCGHESPTASLTLGSTVKIDGEKKKIWML